jgi:predicted transcriptional regulator
MAQQSADDRGNRTMTALMLELPPELIARLQIEAERVGKPISAVVEEWAKEHLPDPPPPSERERARAALRAAGLLLEDPLGPALRQRVEQASVTLDEVSADLERAGGRPLSEIILEQRGPKG